MPGPLENRGCVIRDVIGGVAKQINYRFGVSRLAAPARRQLIQRKLT